MHRQVLGPRVPIGIFGSHFVRPNQSCLHVKMEVSPCLCGGAYTDEVVDVLQCDTPVFSTFSPSRGGLVPCRAQSPHIPENRARVPTDDFANVVGMFTCQGLAARSRAADSSSETP